jgi:hypothetical protein
MIRVFSPQILDPHPDSVPIPDPDPQHCRLVRYLTFFSNEHQLYINYRKLKEVISLTRQDRSCS